MENTDTQKTNSVRHEVQQAALAAARKFGWKRLDRAPIVSQFAERAPISNIYRWIGEARKLPLARSPDEMLADARSGDAALVVVQPPRSAPPLM